MQQQQDDVGFDRGQYSGEEPHVHDESHVTHLIVHDPEHFSGVIVVHVFYIVSAYGLWGRGEPRNIISDGAVHCGRFFLLLYWGCRKDDDLVCQFCFGRLVGCKNVIKHSLHDLEM